MTSYFLVEKLNEGLVRLASEEHGQQLFSIRKMRKPASCANCGTNLSVGDQAFGEVASRAMNRKQRICTSCIFGTE
jgi:hypothetical protein